MNQGYIFSKENNKEYLYYLAFIPLIIYGLYKNAYLLIENNYIKFVDGYKIILFPLVAGLIGLCLNKFIKKHKTELPIIGIILGLCAPFNISMVLYLLMVTIVLVAITFIPNKYRINECALLIVVLLIINHFNHNVMIFNPMELTNMYHFTLLDLFFGRGPSFLFTSSIFWLLISYFILTNVRIYKKNIFPIAILTFSLLSLGYMFVTKEYTESIKLYLNGTTFFSFIMLAPINESSPSIKLEIIIYSILIAVLSFLFVFIIKAHSGAIISVLILSVIYRIYFIIRQKIFFKNR